MKSLGSLKFIILALFVALYMSIYTYTSHNKDERIEFLLNQQINTLSNNYKVALSRFDTITELTGRNLFNNPLVLNILYQAKHAKNEQELARLRENLYEVVNPEFKSLQALGVNIMLFAFENNKTFLRVHKPKKFDDNLSKVRYSFTYVNANKKAISGFEEGKISHAFRNITPLFYKQEYLGSVDLSFSSESIQDNMKSLHNIDTHFILNKHIFDSNVWKSQKKVNYIQSIEHNDFLFSLTPAQNIGMVFSQEKLDVTRALKPEIAENIKNENAFALYFNKDDITYSIAFVPIKDLKNSKTVAYLVSYNKNLYLKNVINEYNFVNILSFLILLLLAFLSYINIKQNCIRHGIHL